MDKEKEIQELAEKLFVAKMTTYWSHNSNPATVMINSATSWFRDCLKIAREVKGS